MSLRVADDVGGEDRGEAAGLAHSSGIPALRRPSYVRSFASTRAWIAALCGEVRLPCRDRLERPGGGQREVALQRLARFGVMTGQGERRHKGRMNILDVIRIDRDRLASQFNRLVIILQPEIGPRLAAVPQGERRIVRARQNRLVEIFEAFVEFPEAYVVEAQVGGGVHVGRVEGERALVLGDGFLGCAPGTEGCCPSSRESKANLDRGRAPWTPIRRPARGRL